MANDNQNSLDLPGQSAPAWTRDQLAECAAQLKAACAAIASRCDGAHDEDGVGFNKADTSFGRCIALVPAAQWDLPTCATVHDLLRKYTRQLEDNGIRYRDLPVPVAVQWERGVVLARLKGQAEEAEARQALAEVWAGRKPRSSALALAVVQRKCTAFPNADGSWDLYSPKDPQLIAALKALPPFRRWTGQCWQVGGEALRHLGKLLDGFGFLVDPAHRARLDQAAQAAAPRLEQQAQAQVVIEGGEAVVRVPYDAAVVEEMKRVPGRRWDSTRKVNAFPLSAAEQLLDLAARRRWTVDPAARQALEAERDARRFRAAASSAADAELEVPGLGSATLRLRPFQRAGVRYALAARRTFIADEMGLGKTVQALGTLQATGAFPALVVVPKAVKLQWVAEARRWLPGRSVLVVEGTAPRPAYTQADGTQAGGYRADLVLVNYDVLAAHQEGLAQVKWAAVVLDESHYIKTKDAQRSKAAVDLAEGVPVRLCLTGTPVLNRPAELINQLKFLGRLDDLGGFWRFANRYCAAQRTKYGLDITGASNLGELAERLRATCFVRREKADVAPELPAIQRSFVPVEMVDLEGYRAALADVIGWMRAQKGTADKSSYSVEALARIEGLKQLVVKHKLAACIEWCRNFLDTNGKLVLFAHHREVQDSLAKALADYRPARITGAQDDADRAAEIERFWKDDTCRVMVASLKAGNVGINLQCASDVAFVEFGWNAADHDQAEARVHRIGSTASRISSYWLQAEDTFDGDLIDLIEHKRGIADSVNRGAAAVQDEDPVEWFERRFAA